MEVDELASRISRIGAEVTSTGTALGHADPGTVAFGGDGPGRLAGLCREMRERLSAAVAARAREANGYGERVDGVAEALRRAATGYREVEETVRARQDGTR